jgi:hypothetical protein
MGKLKIVALCGALVIIVVMPDVIIDLLHGLLELLLAIGHTLFEIIEVTLDALIEHAFHTDLHQTQIIVFYILLLLIFYGLLRLWRAVLGYYRDYKEKWRIAKARHQAQLMDYWQNGGLLKKIQIMTGAIVLITGLFFSLFM